MNLVLWLATSSLIALLASFRAEQLCRQRLLADVMLTGLGAVVAGLITVPMSRWLSFDTDWPGIAAAAAGALAMLALARLRRRS